MCNLLIKSKILLFYLLLLPLVLNSCNNDYDDELYEDVEYMILGDWYLNPDGWKITFYNSTCETTMLNGTTKKYNYTLIDNYLTIENYKNISGLITYIDNNIMRIQRDDMSYIEFKRQPNDNLNGSDSGNGGSDNDNDNDNGNNNGNNNKPPYTSYIHYRYYNLDCYHEITLVKQEVEFAPSGTISGCNYKYLNCYIGDTRKKVGFQFESAYDLYETPPTTPWPAMEYDITSCSPNVITHYPIARVFVYDNNMSLKTQYPTVGVGKIQYSGNKLIFDFTSKEKVSGYYVDLHFEGKLSY